MPRPNPDEEVEERERHVGARIHGRSAEVALERDGEVENEETRDAREEGEAGRGVVGGEPVEMDLGGGVDEGGEVGEGVIVRRFVRKKCMGEVSRAR